MNRSGTTAGLKSLVITLAALFLFIVAVLLDLQYLYLMAATLAMLPLASWTLAALLGSRLSATRHHATTIREGRQTTVQVILRAEGGLPQASVRAGDTLPPALLLPGVGGMLQSLSTWDGRTGEQTYTIEPTLRGVYTLGPLRVETGDPLGLFTFEATLPVTSKITVHPEPLPMRDLAVGGEGMYGVRERDGKTRRGEGMDFHGVREYRVGDALRRVHWPTTARTGKLAVIEFERAYQQDVVIGLDLRRSIHVGEGRETTLEYAVKIAATLADRTLAAGGGVTLVSQAGTARVLPRESDPQAARFRLFDLLAQVQPTSEGTLTEAFRAARLEEETHYALLTASGDPPLTLYLTERVQRGSTVRVYFFDPVSFGGVPVTSPAVPGGELRVIQRAHSPWKEGGKYLEHLLREGF